MQNSAKLNKICGVNGRLFEGNFHGRCSCSLLNKNLRIFRRSLCVFACFDRQISNFLKHFTSICKCTSFSIEIDFKCRPLFSTHRKHTCQARLTIRHAQNRVCQVRLYASLALYSARTETHVQPRLPPVLHSILHE